jgi:cellulose synthase/poly-beta-1,6-N-acetylglucosamine synthase-like glycosyltransferase
VSEIFFTVSFLPAILCGVVIVIWPLASWWLAARSRSVLLPEVSGVERLTFIIAARNEAPVIARTIEQIKRLDSFDTFIVVVSDGSLDKTPELAQEAGADLVVAIPSPVGKTMALARGMENRRAGDVVVFLDATTRFSSTSLAALIAPLSNSEIGAVSGLVVYEYSDTAVGEGFRAYQSLVVWNRITDSHWYTAPSVSGALCAIRPEIWLPTVSPDITPDLAIPLWAARAGFRTLLATDAICHERARTSGLSVFRARVRMAIQAYSFMAYAWSLRRGVPGKYWAAFIGQKAARWLAPVACFIALLSLCWFWPAIGLPLSLTLASPVFFIRLPGGARLFGSAFFFLTVISAYVFGFICFLSGIRAAAWNSNEQRR